MGKNDLKTTYLKPIKCLGFKNNRDWWLFECLLCGKFKETTWNRYWTYNTKSCGCLNDKILRDRGINRVGQKYTRLTLLERFSKRNKKGISLIYYKCKCDCGNITTVVSSKLISNNTKSCGCLDKEQLLKRNQDPFFISKRRNFKYKTYKINHWKTNEDLFCIGSWEYLTLDYLNKNKIMYEWQISFPIDNKVYICDLYLVDEQKYVEIKGRWLKDAKEKFDKVKQLYYNKVFEVWDKPVLKKMGIISKQGQVDHLLKKVGKTVKMV